MKTLILTIFTFFIMNSAYAMGPMTGMPTGPIVGPIVTPTPNCGAGLFDTSTNACVCHSEAILQNGTCVAITTPTPTPVVIPVGQLPAGQIVITNTNLTNCLGQTLSGAAPTDTCKATVDANGKPLAGFATNYKEWDGVISSNGQTLTGLYTKEGMRCSTTVASDSCRFAYKAFYAIQCAGGSNGCVKAANISVYTAWYDAFPGTGKAPLFTPKVTARSGSGVSGITSNMPTTITP